MRIHKFFKQGKRKKNIFNGLLNVDIELTNCCNASCVFCPRDKTPLQGFMDWKVFKKTISRIKDGNKQINVQFCGLGEPLLHPLIAKFVKYANKKRYEL